MGNIAVFRCASLRGPAGLGGRQDWNPHGGANKGAIWILDGDSANVALVGLRLGFLESANRDAQWTWPGWQATAGCEQVGRIRRVLNPQRQSQLDQAHGSCLERGAAETVCHTATRLLCPSPADHSGRLCSASPSFRSRFPGKIVLVKALAHIAGLHHHTHNSRVTSHGSHQ